MEGKNQCYIIMPISDPEGYDEGHFKDVYKYLFDPAIRDAGYVPKRADDEKASNMIQVSIIRDIIESPMAICDLSSRNPNVLFELGIRQAFDLPVVLVQEKGTPRIFDIGTINTIDYGGELLHKDVLEDMKTITEAILQTRDNTKGINSIIRFMGAEPAKKKEGIDNSALLYTIINQNRNILNEISEMKPKWNTTSVQREEKRTIFKNQIASLMNKCMQVTTNDEMKVALKELEMMHARIKNTELFTASEKATEMAKINALIDSIENIEYKMNEKPDLTT